MRPQASYFDPTHQHMAAMGLTESNSGSDPLAQETTARPIEGGHVLNGTRQFCTNGGITKELAPE